MVDLSFSTASPVDADADVLVLPVFEGPQDGPGVKEVGLAGAFADAKLKGRRGEQLLVPRPSGARLAASQVLMLGIGPKPRVSPDALRRAIGRAARRLARFGSVATTLPQAAGARRAVDAVQATAEGLLLGSYRFDRYRTKSEDVPPTELRSVEVLGRPGWDARGARRALERAGILTDAVAWARDLVNTPARDMTPDALAKEAQRMAKAEGLQVRIWKEADLAKGSFGGILGVGQGSANPPRMIELRYQGAAASRRPIGLTGKGISFDSGGLSIKDAKNMEWMKYDMGGAASILATMQAIARLKPRVNVIAAIPSSENMPSGSATRPGDILTHRNGKTSEVLNTDAEGRLVLADALSYLAEQKPQAIIDTATLTGACMVALGEDITGAMGNDTDLINDVVKAGEAAGEPIWELPLWRDYHQHIESSVADVKNVGNRWGGAITAALFLDEFVDGTPWVHLDIAGPAFAEKVGDYSGPGGTGVPVRTLVGYLLGKAGSGSKR